MGKPTISMPDDLEEKIEGRLTYGDSKSGWIREAVQYRFAVDDILDEERPDMGSQERIELVQEAVKEAVSTSD
jgi:metal-responsive CopG/Arc/MetJ family transcriptional regulator